MREITDHVVTVTDKRLKLIVVDAPSYGNAHHHYRCSDSNTKRSYFDVFFQNGPIAEVGVNGVSNEVMLAVVIDRLRCFQSGAFACKENAEALNHLEMSLDWLKATNYG